jgi:hypothetical protein
MLCNVVASCVYIAGTVARTYNPDYQPIGCRLLYKGV